jgi:N-acetylglucosamine kinase-like BadF-type ATPase
MAPDTFEGVISEFSIETVTRAAEGETPRWAARFWIEGHIGVTVDAGTGAMARGWSKDGREAGAGGWGATLGDEGSGYWIGMEAMRAILKAFDGRIKPTLLTDPILKQLDLSDLLDLVFMADTRLVREVEAERQVRVAPDSGAECSSTGELWAGGVYFREKSVRRGSLSRSEVAGLCRTVATVASWGDWKAKEILSTAGHELGEAGAAVIRRLGMQNEEFAVLPFGGVFRAGELVLGAFRNRIEATAPLARIVAPRFEPVVGAILMALDRLGLEINDAIKAAVEQSLDRFPDCCSR